MGEGLVTEKQNAGEENVYEVNNSVLTCWVYSYVRTPRWLFKHVMKHTAMALKEKKPDIPIGSYLHVHNC